MFNEKCSSLPLPKMTRTGVSMRRVLSALTTPGNAHENTANINNILVAVEKSDKNKKGKYASRVSTESDRRQQRKTRVTRAKFVGITSKTHALLKTSTPTPTPTPTFSRKKKKKSRRKRRKKSADAFSSSFFALRKGLLLLLVVVGGRGLSLSLFCEDDDVGNSKRQKFIYFDIFFVGV